MAKKISIGAVLGLEGEKEYRQAISGVNSTIKTLKSEMKLLSAEFAENQNSVEALSAKDRILNQQLEAQKSKVEMLKAALENAKNIYGENDTRVDQWQQSLNNAQVELIRLNDEVRRNQRYLEEAENSTSGVAKSIDSYGRQISVASENTEIFGEVLKANLASEAIVGGIKTLASGIKDVSSSMIDTVKDTAAYADEILTLSNNTGIATDTLQQLKYMQELTDVSLEVVTKSMQKNIRSMSDAAEGSSTYAKAYEKLGVSVTDTNGELRDSEKVFWECIDALGKMQNETERDSISMDLFGKSAQDLNSIIKIGSDGIRTFAEEAEKAGAVLSDETLETLGAADDAFQRIDQAVEIVKRNFGTALAPAVEKATTRISNALLNMDNDIYDIAEGGINALTDGLLWIMDNGEEVISVLGGIGTGLAVYKGATGISSLVSGIQSIGASAEGATSLVTKMGTAIANHPWEAAAIAIGVVTTAVMAIAFACEDTESETEKLLKECESVNEAAEETISTYEAARKARDDSLKAAETEAGKIQILSDKLYDLAEKESLSNKEKLEMKTLVDQINDLYPGLNLAIDENTGALNRSRAEMDATIQTLKEALMLEAAEESLADIAANLFDTQMSLAEASKKQAEAYEVLKKEVEEAGYTMEKFDSLAMIRYNHKLPTSLKKARDAYDEVTEAVNNLTEQERQCNEEYEKVNDIISQNTKNVEENSEANKDNTTVLIQCGEKSKKVSSEMAAEFYKVTAAYEEMKTEAEESIHSQIGLFDEWDTKIEQTSKDILDNMKSQITGMEDWATNIQRCADRGINEGLLKELADMGVKSAGYFEVLAKMTDDEIKELNESYATKLTWEKSLAEELADMSAGMTTGFNELEGKIVSSTTSVGENVLVGLSTAIKNKWTELEGELSSSASTAGMAVASSLEKGITEKFKEIGKNISFSAQTIGENLIKSLNKGIKNIKDEFYDTLEDVGDGGVKTFKKKLKINSPSKVMEEIGEFTGEGYLIGTKKSFEKVNSFLKDAVNTGIFSNYTTGYHLLYSDGTSDSQGIMDTSVIAEAVASALQKVEWKVNFEKETMGRIVSDTILEAYYT